MRCAILLANRPHGTPVRIQYPEKRKIVNLTINHSIKTTFSCRCLPGAPGYMAARVLNRIKQLAAAHTEANPSIIAVKERTCWFVPPLNAARAELSSLRGCCLHCGQVAGCTLAILQEDRILREDKCHTLSAPSMRDILTLHLPLEANVEDWARAAINARVAVCCNAHRGGGIRNCR
jgi:hypothetical protein